MAGYFGSVDKKSIVHILDNGIASLKEDIKESDGNDMSSLRFKFNKLHELLYMRGDHLLSMTNKVRFESRLNTCRKMIERKEGFRA
ncbi:hypothetical protein [Bacillus sp. Bos-x628]|uniref:hypothetical protein n=1 Tax=Bacillus maqinnsis TaxID=3229854 RepID=UPI00338EA58A